MADMVSLYSLWLFINASYGTAMVVQKGKKWQLWSTPSYLYKYDTQADTITKVTSIKVTQCHRPTRACQRNQRKKRSLEFGLHEVEEFFGLSKLAFGAHGEFATNGLELLDQRCGGGGGGGNLHARDFG